MLPFSVIPLSSGLGIYATKGEPRWLEVNRLKIKIEKLLCQFVGFRIVQLSDIHFDTSAGPKYIEKCLQKASQLAPDIIVLTGDYVTKDSWAIIEFAQQMRELAQKFQIYAVLGNHDHMQDVHFIIHHLRSANVQVMINESREILLGNSKIYLLGADDSLCGNFNLGMTMRNIPKEATKIMITHNPDEIQQISEHGIDFVMVGHTHGGQIYLPFIGPLMNPPIYGRKYLSGMFKIGRTQMYVNRGIGTYILPIRFCARPEISVFELSL